MDRDKLTPYVGREQASVKHFLLESYLARLFMITGQARYQRIAYVDAFAGPWQSARDDLSDTSFAKAIDVMESCGVELARQFHRSVTFRALFVERDADRYAQLKRFSDSRSTSRLEIRAINEDFAESSASVAKWIRDDEMTFVLIDPTGWKDVIAPATLAPLLCMRNVELLINVMWNFINLAVGHANQGQNLRDIFGDEYQTLRTQNSISDGRHWMLAYLQRLRVAAGGSGSGTRLRAAWFPVEFPDKDRVFYYLTYVTHHVKGMIVFLQESEKALKYQQEVKFVVKQKSRETATGMMDIFGDDLHPNARSDSIAELSARSHWLALLPAVASEVNVDEALIANMAEECGCLISLLQAALRQLIEEGVLKNTDARNVRPKNVVNYEKGETIRRLL